MPFHIIPYHVDYTPGTLLSIYLSRLKHTASFSTPLGKKKMKRPLCDYD